MNAAPLERLAKSLGWQFNVIRIGRWVLKYPKTAAQTRRAITSRQWGRDLPAARVDSLVHEVACSARNSLASLRRHPAALKHCGNPRFLPLNAVIQRAGDSFLDLMLAKQTTATRVVHHFFDVSGSLWACGLFETTFDFFRNYGMTTHETPFCLDLGDFVDDPSRAHYFLETEYWQTRRDYAALDDDSRASFDNLARQHFTPQSLESIWGTARR